MLASVCILLPQVDFFQGLKQMGKCSQHTLLASLLSLASPPSPGSLHVDQPWPLHQPQDCHLALSVVSQVTWTTAATTSPGIIVLESYVFTPQT